MNILLLGSGGRECALAWKISQSKLADRLFIAPGNGGTGAYGTNVNLSPLDFEALDRFVAENSIDLLVVGNEDPLVAGITDYFRAARPSLLVAGPEKAGAMLEGSKDFAKEFMTE
ncbi:MAG: phosphoribosylamine--glycine ligase, partial [Muribaculaceae bacterium]|nr:phosphoribosylamine--glycine ligase [Muribaculaceae bacterium]